MGQKNSVILKVALPTPIRSLFDYTLEEPADCSHIQPGMRVHVPFGKRNLVGVVVGVSQNSTIPSNKLKPIHQVLDNEPIFPKELLDFFQKAAQYYHHPIGEVVFCGLPQALKKDKPLPTTKEPTDCKSLGPDFSLNLEQTHAIEKILHNQHQYSASLLQGVTGSGKTEVYLEAARHLIKQNKQILILVPEISLTPQTVRRFEQRFGGHVASYHSQLTPAQRRNTFLSIFKGDKKVVVGTRSALFLPFQTLGLIVVDEEHDPSFKQQEGFRYSARDLAVLRAKLNNIPIILGSATPSFETLHNVQIDKYQKIELPTQASKLPAPNIQLLDVRHNKLQQGLSNYLLEAIKKILLQKQQVLLFINRRGFSPVYMCYDCGWFAQCQYCDAKLTYHLAKNKLICHHCERVSFLPEQCPECSSQELNPLGQGTEKIEQHLKQQFPEETIVRVDSDSTRNKSDLTELLEQASQNQARILIGTQILAKGHHFPQLALVAILDADGGLFSTDFRAQERMAQLLIQVSGRAGRVHQAGQVIIQTFHPDHPFMQKICNTNYQSLAMSLLEQRKKAHLPPFSHLALIRANHTQCDMPENFLKQTGQWLKNQYSDSTIQIKGPIPSPFLKRHGRYHFQLLLKAEDRKTLHHAISNSASFLESSKMGKKLRWSLDVDPIEMI